LEFVFEYLREHFYAENTELHYSTPFQLLVAVILSAQCTDKRVNMITPALFQAFPDVWSMQHVDQDVLFWYIKSCSYPNNKAKNILAMVKKLLEDFGGKIPETLKQLQTLPGVGLKTAKVVAHVLYGAPVIAVDTHVFRVVNRLGIVKETDRDRCSEKLEKTIPERYKKIAHHSLIYFGRYWCTAKKPKCEGCGLKGVCPYFVAVLD